MNDITLGTTSIRQLDGLYSLNDLHQAAGGDKNQQPANFLCLDQTPALIAEIQFSEMRSAAKTINGGPKRGTYVCRELVYAYANWISAAFYLKMIRAFDGLQKVGSGGTATESEMSPHRPIKFADYLNDRYPSRVTNAVQGSMSLVISNHKKST